MNAGTFAFATADVLDNWDFDLQVDRFVKRITNSKTQAMSWAWFTPTTPGTQILHKKIFV